MSPGDRCDEIIRLIDRTLDDVERAPEAEPDPVEARAGTWGVFYLRPPDHAV